MSGQSRAKKSKKLRKVGRNAVYCQNYANTNRRERNKVVRLKKHLVRFPEDGTAKIAINRCKAIIGGK